MSNIENTLSFRLNYALRVRKLSSSELAKISGIPLSSLSGYISGKFHPKAEAIIKVADALGTSVHWLLGKTPINTINVPTTISIEDPGEQKLLAMYRQMNYEGKQFVLDFIKVMSRNPKYLTED